MQSILSRQKAEEGGQKIHSFIVQAPVAMCIYKGPDYTVEIANKRMLNIWGKLLEEVIGKPIFEGVPEAKGQGFEALLENVYTTGESFTAHRVPIILNRAGKTETIYINLLYEAYKETDGTISGIIEVANDVTEQVLAIKKAEESEHRYREILSSSLSMISIVKGENMVIEIANDAILEVWGKGKDVIGKPLLQVLPEIAEQGIGNLLREVYNTGKPYYAYETPVNFMRNGKMVLGYYNFIYQAQRGLNGEIEGVVMIANEVTPQAELNKQLKESEERFRSLSNSIPQLAWMTDAAGWIYWYNQRWYDYTGTTLEEMQGWGWQAVHHPDLIEGVTDRFKKAVAAGVPWEDTFLLRGKDGGYRWFLSRALPVYNEEGKIVQWFGTNTDVSAQRQTEEALKSTKEQLELTFQNVPSAIYHFDGAGNFLYLNEKGATQLGYTSAAEVLAEKDLYKFREKIEETFAIFDQWGKPLPRAGLSASITLNTCKPSEVISEHIHRKTGVSLWLLSRSAPLFNEKGHLHMVISTSTDITIQKTSEKAIRESEEKFRTLAESLPQLVWMTDEKGVYEYASRQWSEYSGLDPRDETTWEKLVHPEDMPGVSKVWTQSLQSGHTYRTELRLKSKAGEYRWHVVEGEPVRNEEGKIVKWIGAFADIHDQKTVQNVLRESEERFRTLAATLPQFVWTADAQGNLNYFNQSVYEYGGFTYEELQKDGWIQMVHPDDREENIQQWIHSVTTGEDFMTRHRFLKKTGEYRWQLSRAVTQKDSEGNIKMWVGTSTDIHDQKTVEEKLAALVAERTLELQRSNDDLQQFAHVASHDLKEPVRKIKTFSSRLQEEAKDSLSERGHLYLEKVQSAADRMYMMIDGVLAYSTINVSEQPIEKINLQKIVESVETDLEVLVHQKGATIHCTDLPPIEGASVLIYQLFYNLINNALKFSKAGGQPSIVISSGLLKDGNRDAVQISISDNGIGFGQAQAEKIFDTFSRLNSKDKYEGTGLGLSLCRKIAERHHGSIRAEGVEGEGACFIITLPLTQVRGSI